MMPLWYSDLVCLFITLPLVLNATVFDARLSLTVRIVALVEVDLILIAWLFFRDKIKAKNKLTAELEGK